MNSVASCWEGGTLAMMNVGPTSQPVIKSTERGIYMFNIIRASLIKLIFTHLYHSSLIGFQILILLTQQAILQLSKERLRFHLHENEHII